MQNEHRGGNPFLPTMHKISRVRILRRIAALNDMLSCHCEGVYARGNPFILTLRRIPGVRILRRFATLNDMLSCPCEPEGRGNPFPLPMRRIREVRILRRFAPLNDMQLHSPKSRLLEEKVTRRGGCGENLQKETNRPDSAKGRSGRFIAI